MSDTPSNTHKSWIATISGAALWFITGTGAAIIGHLLPDAWATVFHELGGLIAAIGAATQVHQNTKATIATTTAVQQVTSAPVNLAPNAAIVAAQEQTVNRNPLTNK